MTSNDDFKYASETRADAISFQEVCELLERMSKRKGADKLNLLMPLLTRLEKESAFPLMRLILPELDNLRDKYGMRTTKMASLFAELIFSDKKSKGYWRLKSYTDPERNPSPGNKRWQITGDFALTLEFVLTQSSGIVVVDKTKWTVGDVNAALSKLANAADDAKRKQVLKEIRSNCSPMNHKWIARIILKSLKINLKKSVLNKIHPDALDEYNRTTSLRKVCTAFIGRHHTVRSTTNIEVFMSFSPMLATNFFYKTNKIVPSFEGKAFCMDVKLDGERMLCHREGNKVKWFTRNARDYTDKYGSALTPHILAGVSAQKCVLDGEVVSWNDESGSMVPFGSNRTFAKEELEGTGSGTKWLFYVVFDVLYADSPVDEEQKGGGGGLDEIVRDAVRNSIVDCPPATEVKAGNLTALPLDVRRGVLRSIVTEREHRLEIVKTWNVSAKNEIERKKILGECFNDRAICMNEEGLVVKALHGHYQIGEGSRKTALWVKMKPEYSDQTEDVDLLILAAGFANGKMRSGLLSKFLVGVAVPTEEDGQTRKQFHALVRVGTGFTLNELEDLNELLKDKWRTFDTDPTHFYYGGVMKKPGADGVPLSRWIAPEDSICLQIKCAEIVKSSDWPGVLCTLRFPRVTHIRKDKGLEGCIDTTQLAAVQARPRTAAAPGGRRNSSNQGGHPGAGSRRGGSEGKGRGRKVGGGRQVSELFTVGGEAVTVKENVFRAASDSQKPLEMCVVGTGFSGVHVDAEHSIDVDAWWASTGSRKRKAIGGHEGREKKDIERLIGEYGGTVVANPMLNTTSFVVVGDKGSVSVTNVIGSNKHNVVDYRWVLQCIERKAFEFPSMQHLRAKSPEAKEYFKDIKDDFGDDFTELTEPASLSQLLLNIPAPKRGQGRGEEGASWLSPLREMGEQDGSTLSDGPEFLFAARCLVYCDLFTDLGPIKPPGAASGNGKGDVSAPTNEEIPFNVLASTAQAVRLYGGEVSRSLHVGVTHVVMDPDDATRLGSIKTRIRDLHMSDGQRFHVRVVKPEWAWDCIERGRLVDPKPEHKISLAS
ncbi:unnamed protein product [Pylaiella littoralis]